MIDLLTTPSAIYVLIISVTRMAAVFLILPFFGQQVFSGLTRNAVLVGLALILFPIVAPTVPPEPLPALYIAAIFIKEVVLGVIMGYVLALPFFVADSVGFFIDNQKGATLASVFNPLLGDQTSPLGLFFSQTVTTLFFTLGGFLTLVSGMFSTYTLFPIYSFFPTFGPDFPLFILGFVDTMMTLTVLYAAPVIVCLFLTEFGMGLMNRFAPQLNVFSLAMGVKAGVASLVLVLYMGFLFVFFKNTFVKGDQMFEMLKGVLGH